jgi:hypothetical protein
LSPSFVRLVELLLELDQTRTYVPVLVYEMGAAVWLKHEWDFTPGPHSWRTYYVIRPAAKTLTERMPLLGRDASHERGANGIEHVEVRERS